LNGILLVAVMLSMSSCAAEAPPITEQYMGYLGKRAASGDRKAMRSILDAHHQLYSGIDWKNNSLLCTNCSLMTAAFAPLGEEAARGSKTAKEALMFFVGNKDIRVFAADPLGIAAAAGDKEALSLLLNYERTGFLESTVVSSLVPAANSNVTEAVEFMFRVLEDPTANAIRHFAVSGLWGAARSGNQKARAAVLRHCMEEFQKKPDLRRLQALEKIDASIAREQTYRMFKDSATSRQQKYQFGRYLLRLEAPPGGRRPSEKTPDFVAEYRDFILAAILDGGAKEFCQQKELGALTAVGEIVIIAAGEQPRPFGILFSDIRDPRVVPVLIECLNAPADVSRFGFDLHDMNEQRDLIPLALARLQAVDAIPQLQKIAVSHPSAVFRKNAAFAVDVLLPLAEAQTAEKRQASRDTARRLTDHQN